MHVIYSESKELFLSVDRCQTFNNVFKPDLIIFLKKIPKWMFALLFMFYICEKIMTIYIHEYLQRKHWWKRDIIYGINCCSFVPPSVNLSSYYFCRALEYLRFIGIRYLNQARFWSYFFFLNVFQTKGKLVFHFIYYIKRNIMPIYNHNKIKILVKDRHSIWSYVIPPDKRLFGVWIILR